MSPPHNSTPAQLSPDEWHQRYSQQAGWTQALREHLYRRAGLQGAGRVLEIGCGTGALLPELGPSPGELRRVHGMDLSAEYLPLARSHAPGSDLVQADAHRLPYAEQAFDLALCHFVLLWVRDPVVVLGELRRVTRPGGHILALAEPDYAGRIDYPQELAPLGWLQRESLLAQGADPDTGRKLGAHFRQAGLKVLETGLLGAQWRFPSYGSSLEWSLLEHDLGYLPEGLEAAELKRLRAIDQAALKDGSRVLFVPTFYALARVPLR